MVHEPVQCPAAQGCVLRYCLFWTQIHLLVGDIAAHFSRTTGFAARMGEHCAAISRFWAPNLGAHPTKRSTLLPEERLDLGAGRFEPEGRR